MGKNENLEAKQLSVSIAATSDLPDIFRMRYQVYAEELGQHATNSSGYLCDPIDDHNLYLTVKKDDRLVGFVSITPKGSPKFSIEKYLDREKYPHLDWPSLYELRLLTVCPTERLGPVASILMYTATRWLQEQGAENCIGMGRIEIMKLYQRLGFTDLDTVIRSGNVDYKLMTLDRNAMDDSFERHAKWRKTMRSRIAWNLGFPFDPNANQESCYHGGASIRRMGCEVDRVEAQRQVINADVLDAWFDPSPAAATVLKDHLLWMVRTSPPTNAEEIRLKIAESRSIPSESVVTGAGSSDLIFRAFRHWLTSESNVLLVKPCYAEYEFVCRNVIRCNVDQVVLKPENGFQLDPDDLLSKLKEKSYDLVVVVNPNNPTGAFLPNEFWKSLFSNMPYGPRFWIDECYIDYVDSGHSLESVAATNANVVVCKSLSKCMALSGLRAGYLTCVPELADELRRITPPWNLGTLTQLAISAGIDDPTYYQERYRETHEHRKWMEYQLGNLGFSVTPGTANFFLAELPKSVSSKSQLLEFCEGHQLFLRDTYPTSPELGSRTIRIAVKDPATNQRIIEIVKRGISHA